MGVQILAAVGARHILVGACHNFHFRHRLHPTVHQLGEVLPFLGVVVACSNFHLTKKVAWYLAVEVVALQDPNCCHNHLKKCQKKYVES